MDDEKRLLMMLDQSMSEVDDQSDSDTTIDDSDADPDFVMQRI